MKSNYNKDRKIALFLMFLSGLLLFSVTIYSDALSKIENYNYSTKEEYENVKAGLSLLDKLPTQFNIVNKYFSDFSNLGIMDKEKIVLAYAIKNNIGLVNCDTNNGICISKKVLENTDFSNVFNDNVKLYDENISIYVDGYGMYTAKYMNGKDYYQVPIDTLASDNKLYSSFYKYRLKDDIYTFYLFQGYYKANCVTGDKLGLYDFMTGKEVYEGICNDNGYFLEEPDFDKVDLQLYKYELKKNDKGEFYLYGYNPVNKYN